MRFPEFFQLCNSQLKENKQTNKQTRENVKYELRIKVDIEKYYIMLSDFFGRIEEGQGYSPEKELFLRVY